MWQKHRRCSKTRLRWYFVSFVIISQIILSQIFRTREQSNALRQGCSILIGTPGRINDFRQKFVFLMDEVEFFILDEADRLLDMGKTFQG